MNDNVVREMLMKAAMMARELGLIFTDVIDYLDDRPAPAPLDADQRAMLHGIDGLFDELSAGQVTLSNGVEVISAEDEEARIGAMMMVHAMPIWGDPREALADLDEGEEDDEDNEITAEWPGMEVT
jgi:hypothetical protein